MKYFLNKDTVAYVDDNRYINCFTLNHENKSVEMSASHPYAGNGSPIYYGKSEFPTIGLAGAEKIVEIPDEKINDILEKCNIPPSQKWKDTNYEQLTLLHNILF